MSFNRSLVIHDCPTPLGELTLAAGTHGLAGAWFEDQQHRPPGLIGAGNIAWPNAPAHPVLREAARQIDAYFNGALKVFDLPLDLSAGTDFQRTVWQALLALPRGQTCTYGELSARIGRPSAVRATGGAIGRNPLSVIVPCHRVIGQGGVLTGYAGGLARKRALLQLEGALPSPSVQALALLK
jgi:methylated-DNA-[protein]-cysteine S-methyltransferase